MGKLTGIIQYSGKLSNSVGMRGQDGRNYIRIRRTEIKNPKSDAQCIQRMILATVAKSIAFLSVVLSSAVEGKANGAETLAYLRGQWMRMLRTSDIISADSQYEYLKKNADTFSLNPYLLSKGSIVAPAITVSSYSKAIESSAFEDMDIDTIPSVAFKGIAVGNQITVIAVYNDMAAATDGITPRRVKYCRFAFKDDTLPALVQIDTSIRLNSNALDLVKAEGEWEKLSFSPDSISLNDFIGTDNELVGASILISNIEGKQRSTSYLVLADGVAKQWFGAEAYLTYGDQAVSIDMASSEYLNNSAVVGGDVTGVVTLPNAPVLINYDQTKSIQLNGVPSQPTEVHLVFHDYDGTNTETGNLVGVSANDIIIAQRIKCSTAPSYLSEVWNIGVQNYDGQSAISVIGGYAICDGVKYTF